MRECSLFGVSGVGSAALLLAEVISDSRNGWNMIVRLGIKLESRSSHKTTNNKKCNLSKDNNNMALEIAIMVLVPEHFLRPKAPFQTPNPRNC